MRLILGALVLVSLAAFCTAANSLIFTAPVFLWGSDALVASGPPGTHARVSYETTPAAFVVEDLLGGLLAKRAVSAQATGLLNATSLQQAKPEIVVLFLGGQLNTEDLARLGASSSLKPLQDALEAAGSSLTLPYVMRTAHDSLEASARSYLEAQGLGDSLHLLGSCAPAASAVDSVVSDVRAVLERCGGTAQQVVVVCAAQVGSLDQELSLLRDVVAAVQQSGTSAAFVYAAEPTAQDGTARRALLDLSAPQPGALCTEKCRMQVRVIECIILGMCLLVALFTGMCCMNMLDTPTRFETPKESHAQ